MFIRSQESGFPGGSEGKESACNVGDPGSIPGLARTMNLLVNSRTR